MATYEAVIELRFGKSLVGKDCRYNGDIVWRQSKNGPKSDKLKISSMHCLLPKLRLTLLRLRLAMLQLQPKMQSFLQIKLTITHVSINAIPSSLK